MPKFAAYIALIGAWFFVITQGLHIVHVMITMYASNPITPELEFATFVKTVVHFGLILLGGYGIRYIHKGIFSK